MCNLTSQAQHASPLWESTQKTLSPKSKARLHRYVLTRTATQISLFLPFTLHSSFLLVENTISSLCHTVQRQYIYINCYHAHILPPVHSQPFFPSFKLGLGQRVSQHSGTVEFVHCLWSFQINATEKYLTLSVLSDTTFLIQPLLQVLLTSFFIII